MYVSLGAKKIELRDYSNLEVNSVKEELRDLGLKFTVKEMPDNNVPKGFVVSTNPAAGSTVRTGHTITLYVSTGEAEIKRNVPDVDGMSLEDAKKEIENKGFKVGSVVSRYSSDIAEGYVISQSPESGEAVLGSAISLIVSKGEEPQTEPPTAAPPVTEPPAQPNTDAPANNQNGADSQNTD